MNNDQEKWNQRYRDKPMQPPEPTAFICEILPRLSRESALDIASGDGSTSLFLAQQGFAVTAVDISSTALARQARFATALGVMIETLCCDLNVPLTLSETTRFDTITLTRYRPSDRLLMQLIDLLKPGGTLAISAFSAGINPRFCLQPGALKTASPDLELLHYHNRISGASALDEYLFRRIA